MKNDFAHVVFILDMSGSMSDVRDDVIGGFNTLIDDLKKLDENTLVTTVLFNHTLNRIHDKVNINELTKLTKKEYSPSGCTALLDAIGYTLDSLDEEYKENSPSKTIIYINTDGEENSSNEYSYKMINKMIKWHKNHDDFEINFVAANIDEKEYGDRLGVDPHNVIRFDSHSKEGIAVMYGSMSARLCAGIKPEKIKPEPKKAPKKDNKK